MDRELDDIFFRVQRGERFVNLCFSDLDLAQMHEVLAGRDVRFLNRLCAHLVDRLEDWGGAAGYDLLVGDLRQQLAVAIQETDYMTTLAIGLGQLLRRSGDRRGWSRAGEETNDASRIDDPGRAPGAAGE